MFRESTLGAIDHFYSGAFSVFLGENFVKLGGGNKK